MANFVDRLIVRLSSGSQLLDASRGTVHGDLDRAIPRIAGSFVSSGLSPGDRLVLACELTCESAFAYLACMHAGLIAVPVEPAMAETAVAATQARGLWRPRAHTAAGARADIELVGLGDAAARPPHPADDEDPAALMATSGSSGRAPRFVRVSHGNLTVNTDAIARSQELGPDDRALLILPLFYCFGLSVLQSHLWAGGSVVFQRQFMFPQKAVDSIRSYRCTTFAGVPTSYTTLLARTDYPARPCPSLRRQLQAGGRLAPSAIDSLRAAHPDAGVYVMYGQTEATARISTLRPEEWPARRGSVGRPLDGVEVALRPLAEDRPEDVGELLVRGPSITDGYWGQEPRPPGDWLATGDIARIDPEGFLYIEGRLSEFVKIRGIRVSLAEVDAILAGVSGLREVAACGVPDPEFGEALLVAAVPSDEDPDPSALEAAMRDALPAAWEISEVRFLPTLPRTGSGKLARGRLAETPAVGSR